MKRLTSFSEDTLKTRLIHEDSERFRRAVIVAFTGVTVLILIAWLLIDSLSLDQILPVTPLKYLVGIAFVMSVVTLSLALFSRRLQLAMSIMAIFISLQFIPTLIFTGGFISPFIVLYLLAILLSSILVDLVPKKIGLINFSIITGSYILISLVQKAGMLPYKIDYVEKLLKLDYFFWLVFVTVCFSFIHGYIAVYGSSRNIRDTFTQMILTYRHVAEGTSVLTGKKFATEICEALRKSLDISMTFLIEFDNEKNNAALISVIDGSGVKQYERTISDEFITSLMGANVDNNKLRVTDIAGFPVSIESKNDYVYMIKIHDVSGNLCDVLGIIDASINKVNGVLAVDILQIFANRISSEVARSAEEKKRLQMQQLFGQGQKMQAIGKLANVIAHDFNNILNGIFGFVSLIKKTADPDSDQTKYAEKIFHLGNNATALISQLLSYSRTNTINFVSFDINSIVDVCLEIVRLTLKKPIKVISVHQQAVNVFGDESMVQSALLNLAINACDAIENQGELIVKVEKKQMVESDVQDFISGKFVPPGEYIVVSVSDTGCGIPKDQLTRIFEPFYTTKAAGRGTGLGLAAVVGCMEAHKGFITVSSFPGSGSTFCLYFTGLVLQQESETDSINILKEKLNKEDDTLHVTIETLKSTIRENTASTNQHYGYDSDSAIDSINQLSDSGKNLLRRKIKKVLIVDDDVMILDSISIFLKSHGYDILTCNSGENAIKMFETNRNFIDIAILDMIIPDISGRVLLDRFRVLKPELKVVMMTGFSNSSDIEYVKTKDVITILYKPFEFNVIDTILLGMASGILLKNI
jgi:signal transduction histidine kinase/ActR/RegA family two-component response regulator